MPNHKRRNRSLPFDQSEKRETQDSVPVVPFSHIPLAASSKPGPFHATGSAMVSEFANDGAFTAVVRGRASLLGVFTGFLSVTALSKAGAHVQLQMNGKQNTILQITMTVLCDGNNGEHIEMQGTYAVAHGTGPLAHAIGGGKVTGVLNRNAQTLSFDLQGTIAR